MILSGGYRAAEVNCSDPELDNIDRQSAHRGSAAASHRSAIAGGAPVLSLPAQGRRRLGRSRIHESGRGVKVRVLVNATPLVRGGAIQVAVSIIRESIQDPAAGDWQFLVSPQIARNLSGTCDSSQRRFHVLEHSPARSWRTRRQMAELERVLSPDAVFSIFGPTFVRFKAPHLMGVGNGWVTHPSRLALQSIPGLLPRAGRMVRSWYAGHWLSCADSWVAETETARRGLISRFHLPDSKVAVVANTCGSHYLADRPPPPFPGPRTTVRILCFASAYPHKCLDLIPDFAVALRNRLPQLSFEFVLTLPQNEAVWKRIRTSAAAAGVENHIQNVGVVPIADGPALYQSCHISFLPTVLETFSATYPESMAMGLPIVTSDLDFARDTCGDAAAYFAPRNAEAAATAIAGLLENPLRWQRLVDCGRQRLQTFPTPAEKYRAYCELLRRLVAGRSLLDFQWRNGSTSEHAA